MKRTIDTIRELGRPGLPLDPLLQLAAGALTALSSVSVPTATWTLLAPADPLRVVLYAYPSAGSGQMVLGPPGLVTPPTPATGEVAPPLAIHVRDYPGLVQGDVWVWAQAAGIVQWQSYKLSNDWRA